MRVRVGEYVYLYMCDYDVCIRVCTCGRVYVCLYVCDVCMHACACGSVCVADIRGGK